MAAGSRVEFWRARGQPISREAVFAWMDNFCRRYPSADVIVGAYLLMDERSAGEWSRQQKRLK